ncbi:sigma-54 dependent transcriptional regulator [Pseudooceanicola sp. CBS1P-1]|uniref:Response regulator n=1 Tax=Pseudooceanicola albus TaxID=2692189 RepID=A0A6L7G7M6_9RHOB|nr:MULTISPECIES: sigma-54 dependent transcriptional regulator [Pseudooceanicola]MBT9385034.1 sigma-54 dependent transcriptional regulator [Pseudooceanicola endophyticus]MXN18673.1 response regulator [Pseudooceanicola albus]
MSDTAAPDSAGLVRLVEDDAALLAAQAQGLKMAGFTPEPFPISTEALADLGPDWPGVVLSDVRMPGIDGIELAARIRALDPELPVILLTGHGDVEMAVQALHDGVYDFLTKPVSRGPLEATLRRALAARRLVLENRRLRQAQQMAQDKTQVSPADGLVGQSPAIRHMRETADHIAGAGINALFLGEAGVGKERLARHIHSLSPRRARPFVAVNCAAIAPERFDAEYLGTVASGGPHLRNYGRIESASRGMLYLDGIEALPPGLQARMLEVIETGTVWPTGASAPRPVDLWVIASSRTDLAAEVAAGRFRDDLYYRLSGLSLTLPPLRARREDVPLLFRHFVQRFAERTGRRAPPLSEVDQAHLDTHDWPGNLRELEQFAETYCLGLEAMPEAPGEGASLAELVSRYEAALLRNALRQAGGNATEAMARLQIPRKTFYDKLAKHGIRSGDFR